MGLAQLPVLSSRMRFISGYFVVNSARASERVEASTLTCLLVVSGAKQQAIEHKSHGIELSSVGLLQPDILRQPPLSDPQGLLLTRPRPHRRSAGSQGTPQG